jgi:hypothetical protein
VIVPFIAALLLGQAPKTFEDLEIAKIVAMHDLKRVRMEFNLELPPEQGETHKLTYSRLVMGDHCRSTVRFDDEVQVDMITAPPYLWIVMPKAKKYTEIKDTTPKAQPFDPKQDLLKADPDTFNFKCDECAAKFAPAKEISIQSIETVHEGKAEYRKVIASIKSKSTGHVLTITQWFLPDKWIVKRFSIIGESSEGPVNYKGEATVIDLDPKLKDSDFVLDMSAVAGFEKTVAGPNGGSGKLPLR